MGLPTDLLLPVVPGVVVLAASGAMAAAGWRQQRKQRKAQRKARGFEQRSHVSMVERGDA